MQAVKANVLNGKGAEGMSGRDQSNVAASWTFWPRISPMIKNVKREEG